MHIYLDMEYAIIYKKRNNHLERKINCMEKLLDLHCHTLSSGHAYSTLEEMIQGAKRNGVKVMGMSDHAPTMPGAPHRYFFQNLVVLPSEVDGVTILKGVEANIIDFDGNIDMDEHDLKNLDYVIASFHPPCIDFGTIEENTSALLKVMENPYVKVIGHPDDSRYPLDYEKVVLAAKKNSVALEVNNSSLNPGCFRIGAHENAATFLKLCKEHSVKIIFGSDAHISFDVGAFHNCLELAEKVDFPKELIINYNSELINDLIGRKVL